MGIEFGRKYANIDGLNRIVSYISLYIYVYKYVLMGKHIAVGMKSVPQNDLIPTCTIFVNQINVLSVINNDMAITWITIRFHFSLCIWKEILYPK